MENSLFEQITFTIFSLFTFLFFFYSSHPFWQFWMYWKCFSYKKVLFWKGRNKDVTNILHMTLNILFHRVSFMQEPLSLNKTDFHHNISDFSSDVQDVDVRAAELWVLLFWRDLFTAEVLLQQLKHKTTQETIHICLWWVPTNLKFEKHCLVLTSKNCLSTFGLTPSVRCS